jgi:hypothetical protein
VKTQREAEDITFCFYVGKYKGNIRRHLVEYHNVGNRTVTPEEAEAKLRASLKADAEKDDHYFNKFLDMEDAERNGY